MGGLGGFYLGAVNALGKGILFLLIGSKAFGPGVRTSRLLLGSLVLGVILGPLLVVFFDVASVVGAMIGLGIGGAIFAGVVTGILEAVRHRLEK